MKTAATHDGSFHADEVYCTAAVKLIWPKIKILRTRDGEKIKEADIVYDVGKIHNPSKDLFDHHQRDFDVTRPNGLPMSSFGLLWQKYSKDVIKSIILSEYKRDPFMDNFDDWYGYISSHVDRHLVAPIDVIDNGYGYYVLSVTGKDTAGMVMNEQKADTLSNLVGRKNKPWFSDKPDDNRKWFDAAVVDAMQDLKTIVIESFWFQKTRNDVITKVLNSENSSHPHVLILDRYIRGVEIHLRAEEVKDIDIHFVVFSQGDQWKIMSVSETAYGSFTQKTSLPSEWAGLDGDDLVKASGYHDAVFVHRNRHFAVFGSKESALSVVNTLLNHGRTIPRVSIGTSPLTQN
tara:strand:- start:485 stop:1525 length:1041 start_codon:yes stop_codon:yes gene_type:complete